MADKLGKWKCYEKMKGHSLPYVRFSKKYSEMKAYCEVLLGSPVREGEKQNQTEGEVAMHWQKTPQSTLQEVTELRWPFRVVPNQNKG